MRKLLFILTAAIFSFTIISCGGEAQSTNGKEEKAAQEEQLVLGTHKVEVYYFHADRRCPSCNAVENVAKQTVTEQFANNEDVKFFSINFDRSHNKEIAAKYDIKWSSLIIVSGEKLMDLTLEGFQHAGTNPEIFEKEIVQVINEFLNS